MSDEHSPEAEHGKPAPDDSPPQNGLIFLYTVLTVLTLVGLKFVFDSFLDSSRRTVQAGHISESVASARLAEHREEVRRRLSEDGSIDETISSLAERGRGAYPQIRPFPSEDRGSREGWGRRAPVPAPVTPEPRTTIGR